MIGKTLLKVGQGVEFAEMFSIFVFTWKKFLAYPLRIGFVKKPKNVTKHLAKSIIFFPTSHKFNRFLIIFQPFI